MAEIILVDDDANILTSLRIALEAEGFGVRCFTDGRAALDALAETPADIGVFDIKMPRMDGLELLRRLRATSSMPVVFLTSKDAELDELFGLKMGADDYITKPFSQRLLMARLRTILHRTQARRTTPDAPSETQDGLALDEARHECMWRGHPVDLTVTEFLILQALVRRPGHVKNRAALMGAAYDDQTYVDDRTIDSHIKRMRGKFRAADPDFDAIETLYGVGYRYKQT